jgi:hypothetical protein
LAKEGLIWRIKKMDEIDDDPEAMRWSIAIEQAIIRRKNGELREQARELESFQYRLSNARYWNWKQTAEDLHRILVTLADRNDATGEEAKRLLNSGLYGINILTSETRNHLVGGPQEQRLHGLAKEG